MFKLGDRAVLVDPDVDQKYRNRPGVVVELYSATMRILFDDDASLSPGYYFRRFKPSMAREPSFTVDYSTDNVDEATEIATILAAKLGRAVAVKRI